MPTPWPGIVRLRTGNAGLTRLSRLSRFVVIGHIALSTLAHFTVGFVLELFFFFLLFRQFFLTFLVSVIRCCQSVLSCCCRQLYQKLQS